MTGYKPGGGKTYAAHVLKMVTEYTAYKQQVKYIDKEKFSGADLKKLYDKSKELGLPNDTHKIIKAGINSNYAHFFQVERYRALAEEGMVHELETVALRQKILAEDPRNEQKTHYDVAVIDFEAFCEELNKETYSPQLAVAPLEDYIKKFGHDDKENTWRLEMIISQVYLDKNRLEDALEHAQSSHDYAPTKIQPEIATAIKNIELKLAATANR
jgi:protein disulfide-isomerase